MDPETQVERLNEQVERVGWAIIGALLAAGAFCFWMAFTGNEIQQPAEERLPKIGLERLCEQGAETFAVTADGVPVAAWGVNTPSCD